MNKPLRKKKYVKGNQSPLMNTTLSKSIMQRSKSETFSSKIELKKTEIFMLNRGTYVLHFRKKVRESFMVILMRKNYVKIKNFGGVGKPEL